MPRTRSGAFAQAGSAAGSRQHRPHRGREQAHGLQDETGASGEYCGVIMHRRYESRLGLSIDTLRGALSRLHHDIKNQSAERLRIRRCWAEVLLFGRGAPSGRHAAVVVVPSRHQREHALRAIRGSADGHPTVSSGSHPRVLRGAPCHGSAPGLPTASLAEAQASCSAWGNRSGGCGHSSRLGPPFGTAAAPTGG